VNHNLTDTQLLAELENTGKGGDQILGVMLIAAAEGGVGLVEDSSTGLRLGAEGLCGVSPVLGKHETVVAEQGYIQGGIARVQHGVHGGVYPEAGG
jgi:hypothetical protein